MKIVLIVDYYYPAVGGAEILYQKLAEGLVGLGHDVSVLTQKGVSVDSEEVVGGVKVYRVSTTHRALFPYQGLRIGKMLVQEADIVQAGPYASGVLAAKLRKFTKAKIILSVYEYLSSRWLTVGAGGYFAYWYEKYLFRFYFDHYVAISESTRTQLLRKGIEEPAITRIYCGIDKNFFQSQELNVALRRKLGISDQTFVCLYAGRPGVTKGIWTLMEAIERIRNSEFGIWNLAGKNETSEISRRNQPQNSEFQTQNLGLRFVLILGAYPVGERKKVMAFIKEKMLEDVVLVLESVPREDLPSYLAMANVVIVPSLTEGFGFFAAEVSAMRIPLIVSKVDALPEVVSGKVIFVEPGNAASIVGAIEKAQKNEFTEIPTKPFNWEDTCREYEKLYQELIV